MAISPNHKTKKSEKIFKIRILSKQRTKTKDVDSEFPSRHLLFYMNSNARSPAAFSSS